MQCRRALAGVAVVRRLVGLGLELFQHRRGIAHVFAVGEEATQFRQLVFVAAELVVLPGRQRRPIAEVGRGEEGAVGTREQIDYRLPVAGRNRRAVDFLADQVAQAEAGDAALGVEFGDVQDAVHRGVELGVADRHIGALQLLTDHVGLTDEREIDEHHRHAERLRRTAAQAVIHRQRNLQAGEFLLQADAAHRQRGVPQGFAGILAVEIGVVDGERVVRPIHRLHQAGAGGGLVQLLVELLHGVVDLGAIRIFAAGLLDEIVDCLVGPAEFAQIAFQLEIAVGHHDAFDHRIGQLVGLAQQAVQFLGTGFELGRRQFAIAHIPGQLQGLAHDFRRLAGAVAECAQFGVQVLPEFVERGLARSVLLDTGYRIEAEGQRPGGVVVHRDLGLLGQPVGDRIDVVGGNFLACQRFE